MILALIGDLHISERSPRFAHVLDVLDFAIDDALAQGATHFALLGDLFEQHPTGTEYAALLDRVHRMREHGPVIAILGNHESYAALAFWHHVGVRVAWESIVSIDTPEARVLAIPYPRRGRPPFNDLDGETIGETMQSAAARIANVVRAHLDSMPTPRPLIVLGHFTIAGMTTRDADFEQHAATEVIVPRAAFDGCALVAVGHVHLRQEVAENIIGIGSLVRHSWAERADPKSYTLVTVEASRVTYEHRDVPAHELWQYEGEWGARGWIKELARG